MQNNIVGPFLNPPKACIHLRGANQHTMCGHPITPNKNVPGLPGFRLCYSTRPDSVCLTCLKKSRSMRELKRTDGQPEFPCVTDCSEVSSTKEKNVAESRTALPSAGTPITEK